MAAFARSGGRAAVRGFLRPYFPRLPSLPFCGRPFTQHRRPAAFLRFAVFRRRFAVFRRRFAVFRRISLQRDAFCGILKHGSFCKTLRPVLAGEARGMCAGRALGSLRLRPAAMMPPAHCAYGAEPWAKRKTNKSKEKTERERTGSRAGANRQTSRKGSKTIWGNFILFRRRFPAW